MQRKIVEDQSTENDRDIWSAIRYLDPDKKNEDCGGTTKTVLVLILICILLVLVHFRVL